LTLAFFFHFLASESSSSSPQLYFPLPGFNFFVFCFRGQCLMALLDTSVSALSHQIHHPLLFTCLEVGCYSFHLLASGSSSASSCSVPFDPATLVSWSFYSMSSFGLVFLPLFAVHHVVVLLLLFVLCLSTLLVFLLFSVLLLINLDLPHLHGPYLSFCSVFLRLVVFISFS
jgi:hypothetical protein